VSNSAARSTCRCGPVSQRCMRSSSCPGCRPRPALWLAQAFTPGMAERGFGRIVFITSDTFWEPPTPMLLPYVASKGALVGIMRTLARALGADGIAVTAVAPGLTDTPGARTVNTDVQFDAAVRSPGRFRRGMWVMGFEEGSQVFDGGGGFRSRGPGRVCRPERPRRVDCFRPSRAARTSKQWTGLSKSRSNPLPHTRVVGRPQSWLR
jgi:NAD(P)-dependent dehydrogenase (short-subunit alcohol dehydrogenase family)